jgi:hypothetical protein
VIFAFLAQPFCEFSEFPPRRACSAFILSFRCGESGTVCLRTRSQRRRDHSLEHLRC